MLSIARMNQFSQLPIAAVIKMLVVATYASMLVAAGSGIAMVLVRPPDSDSVDSTLGAIVGVPSMAPALFGSLSIVILLRSLMASQPQGNH
jgi:hypothetical protein